VPPGADAVEVEELMVLVAPVVGEDEVTVVVNGGVVVVEVDSGFIALVEI
jgi:hypothetical protein